MCEHPDFRFHARVYITSKYARIPLMWGNTLFEQEDPDGEPDFVTITVSEWPERRVMVFPEEGLTIILGTDYKGENKKAMLRQLMYAVKKRQCLGLHAGSKTVRVSEDGKLSDVGFLFFGLSGTGKTSLTCHSHWLESPERVFIHQDDVVILRPDGSAMGTENSYYIKTDALDLDSQPLLYAACLSPRSILENVMVYEDDARIDFYDSSITSNGRAMVKRSDVAFTDTERRPAGGQRHRLHHPPPRRGAPGGQAQPGVRRRRLHARRVHRDLRRRPHHGRPGHPRGGHQPLHRRFGGRGGQHLPLHPQEEPPDQVLHDEHRQRGGHRGERPGRTSPCATRCGSSR